MTAAPSPEIAVDLEPTHQALLEGIDWQTYLDLRRLTDDHGSHVKFVYDNGSLLIEMPNKFHEVVKTFVGRVTEAFLEAHDIDFSPLGSTTWKREFKHKGIEADECYYIQNAAIADDNDEVNLEVDPPPDLAIEVEIATPLLPKLPVYASIGVPEIWHLVGWEKARILALDPVTGLYHERSSSVAAPSMTPDLLRDLVATRRTLPHRAALNACRQRWRRVD